MIDRTLLSKGEEFEDLVDTYVIFITENDKYGEGILLYHIERKITELDILNFKIWFRMVLNCISRQVQMFLIQMLSGGK